MLLSNPQALAPVLRALLASDAVLWNPQSLKLLTLLQIRDCPEQKEQVNCCWHTCPCFLGRKLSVNPWQPQMGNPKKESETCWKVIHCASAKKNCRKAVNFSLVFKLCCTFWSLSKAGQDCVLWGIQNMQTGMENTEDDNDSDGGSSSDYSGTSSGSDNAEQSSKLLNTWYIQGGANLEDELI